MGVAPAFSYTIEVTFSTSKMEEKKTFKKVDVEELVVFIKKGKKARRPRVVAMGQTIIINFSLDGKSYKLMTFNTSSPSNVVGSWNVGLKEWEWISCLTILNERPLFANAILGYRILRFGELTKHDKRLSDAKKAPLPVEEEGQ